MMASQTAATRFEDTPEAVTVSGPCEPALPLRECSNGGAGIELANAANPLPLTISLEQLTRYKIITGTLASAVLFAFYEQCFKVLAPGANILTAPIDHWRIDGFLGIKEFYRALQPFGYRYYSRVKFEAARSAQREWIHPMRTEWLLYILVHDQSTQTDRLIRNGALITAKLTGYKPDLHAVMAAALKMTAKAEVCRFRERFL